jgi:hypothetical protein
MTQEIEAKDTVRAARNAAVERRAVVVIREILSLYLKVTDDSDEIRAHVSLLTCQKRHGPTRLPNGRR